MIIAIISKGNKQIEKIENTVKTALGIEYDKIILGSESSIISQLENSEDDKVMIFRYSDFPLLLSDECRRIILRKTNFNYLRFYSSPKFDSRFIVGSTYYVLEYMKRNSKSFDRDLTIRLPIISIDLDSDNSDIINLFTLLSKRSIDSKMLDIMNFMMKRNLYSNQQSNSSDIVSDLSLITKVGESDIKKVLTYLVSLSYMYLYKMIEDDEEIEDPVFNIHDSLYCTLENGKLVLFSSNESNNSIVEKAEKGFRSILELDIMKEKSNFLSLLGGSDN